MKRDNLESQISNSCGQKVCTKPLSLPDNAKKNSIFSPSAKVKICTLQGSTPSLTKQVKTLWMDLFWNHFNSSLQGKTHIDLKSSNLPFKKNSTHHHSNPAHLQARELCPLTYSLSLPLEWSQVTHIPTSIKWAGPTSPKSHLCQTTVDDTDLRDGSLPFQHTHKHSSPLQQAF